MLVSFSYFIHFLSCLSTSFLQTVCKFLLQIDVRTSVITRENDFLHSYCYTFIVQLCQKQLSERGSVKIISKLFMLFLCLYIVRRGSRRLLVVHNPFQNFYFIARGINHHFRKKHLVRGSICLSNITYMHFTSPTDKCLTTLMK